MFTLPTRLTLAAVFSVFALCNVASASMYTATECSAIVGTHSFSQSGPSSCGIHGYVEESSYVVDARSYASLSLNEGVGYAYIATNILTANTPDAQVQASVIAQVSQTYTSPGPERIGSITFFGGCFVANSIAIKSCGGIDTFKGARGTVQFITPTCTWHYCDVVSYPLELGTTFSMSLLTRSIKDYDGEWELDQEFFFALTDSDGRAVPIELASTTTPMPEPSGSLLTGVCLLGTTLFARCRSLRMSRAKNASLGNMEQ